jgi:polysaccharide export outer membrane protein
MRTFSRALGAAICAVLLLGGDGRADAAGKTSGLSSPQGSATTERHAYRLGVGDKLHISVFDEPNLAGDFEVNAKGDVSFPLIGDVPAAARTSDQLAQEIARRLRNGYLRAPSVSIEVATRRPFYIMGEVNKPGEYPYEPDITVLDAVAEASGFTDRADKRHVFIKNGGQDQEARYPLRETTAVAPGEVVRIGEQFF